MSVSRSDHLPSPFPRYAGKPADLVVFEQNISDLSAKLEVYDKILGKQKYLAGDVR